ncbi:hypothetical protein RSOL_476690 [Rhizoctonia solani AG-3 Rhs1AP]|uniref:Uncharacterized protein n=2 Tax=Rhizoctonia solani AG-3 TaxID=1086053 RepID=A0A074SP46_9AGAM|nr:hypothetical protein RSOL_476690 [Rhizoctonia solani AG-3 Rhs1AP]KEP51757.1 hypothetical protein V565_056340 [Rhizoctonia solani 123E]
MRVGHSVSETAPRVILGTTLHFGRTVEYSDGTHTSAGEFCNTAYRSFNHSRQPGGFRPTYGWLTACSCVCQLCGWMAQASQCARRYKRTVEWSFNSNDFLDFDLFLQ